MDLMKKIVLDCNVYDLLARDRVAVDRIRELVTDGEMKVLVPASLASELCASPFRGVPDWFPSESVADTVFILDHSRLDEARLGDGETYTAHLGTSRKVADAVLADTAELNADGFVSEDGRARRGLARAGKKCEAMTFAEFRARILGL
jgi:hypothetical protein